MYNYCTVASPTPWEGTVLAVLFFIFLFFFLFFSGKFPPVWHKLTKCIVKNYRALIALLVLRQFN